jgi:hypothetical protein
MDIKDTKGFDVKKMQRHMIDLENTEKKICKCLEKILIEVTKANDTYLEFHKGMAEQFNLGAKKYGSHAKED